MGRIHIGTCSWSDFTSFYPPGLPSSQQISYYAQRFTIVEVNASFYRLMPWRTYAAWAERTPAGFLFDVKPFQQLTWHDRKTPPTPEVAGQFSAALQPLREAAKLGALTFQFPPWFVFRPDTLAYVVGLRALFPSDPIGIEFRHRSWLQADNLPALTNALTAANLALGIVDEPQIGSGSAPLVPLVTTPELSVVRFHGRNAALWYARVERASDRFDYLYNQDELESWAPTVVDLAAQAGQVHLLFNNNVHDYAIENALQLRALLSATCGEQVALPAATPHTPLLLL